MGKQVCPSAHMQSVRLVLGCAVVPLTKVASPRPLTSMAGTDQGLLATSGAQTPLSALLEAQSALAKWQWLRR